MIKKEWIKETKEHHIFCLRNITKQESSNGEERVSWGGVDVVVFFFCFNVIVGCLLSLLWCFCVYWYRKWMFLFRGSIMMRFTGTWVSMTITLSRLRLEHWRLLRYSSSASSPSSCYLCVSAFSYLYVFLIFTLLIWLFIAIISGYCDEQLL